MERYQKEVVEKREFKCIAMKLKDATVQVPNSQCLVI
jgi:hypothetical protein